MIALDPKQTFDFFIEADAFKPDRRRLKFTSRFPTHLQLLEMNRCLARAEGMERKEPTPDLAGAKKAVLEALAVTTVAMSVPLTASEEAFAFSLDIEAAAAADCRTTFHSHLLSKEELERAKQILNAAATLPDEEQVESLKTVIRMSVDRITVGAAPTDGEQTIQGATMAELREIAGKAYVLSRLAHVVVIEDLEIGDLYDIAINLVRQARLTEIDRKKSALRSASLAARSFATAVAGRA